MICRARSKGEASELRRSQQPPERRERERRYARERYYMRSEAGLCTGCGSQPEPGNTMCARCLKKKAARQQRRYMRLQALGLDANGPMLCVVCLRDKPTIAEGMCGTCCEALATAQLGERNDWRQRDIGDETRLRLCPAEQRRYEQIATTNSARAVTSPAYRVSDLIATIRDARV